MRSDKEVNELKKFTRHSDEHTVHSIAEMEYALAHLLNTKVNVLEKNAEKWSAKEIKSYMAHLESTLKKVVLKEIVMLLLLDEQDRKPKKCHQCNSSQCECYRKCRCVYGEQEKSCYSRRICQCFSW